MGKKLLTSLSLFALLFLTTLSIGCEVKQITKAPSTYKVTNVVDGDTLDLSTGEKVRLLGIDAPEANQPGGDIARAFLEKLVLNKEVVLKKDVTDKDKYGRLLRFVYVGDTFVNAEMIKRGYAIPRFYPPDERYKEQFEKLRDEAEKNKRGLWALGVFQPKQLTPPSSIPPTQPQKWGSSDEGVISWQDAAQYYGQVKTVEGTVVDTHNSGKAVFLNFHPDWKTYFTAVIFASDFKKFPQPPEDYYLNKEVRVRGLIKEYQGKPEIIVENPSQIEVAKGQ